MDKKYKDDDDQFLHEFGTARFKYRILSILVKDPKLALKAKKNMDELTVYLDKNLDRYQKLKQQYYTKEK